jgi:hypothetical protein
MALRGHLGEFGIIAPAGRHRVRHQSASYLIAALIRDTVPLPTPTSLATFLMPSPDVSRARMVASTLAPVLGRPRRTPLDFARSQP